MKKIWKNLKWMILFFALIMVCFLGYKLYQEYQAKKLDEESVIKVACVGDSNTYRHGGNNVDEQKYSYHLGRVLGDGYEVKNFGEVGACVNPSGNLPYTSLRVFDASVNYEADILIVMLGTNDVWDHTWVSEEYFVQEYEKLLDAYLKTDVKPEIYLCSLPKLYQEDGNTLETGTGERIEILSNAIRGIATERGYKIIEINHVTDNHREWYADDLLHINEEGAKGIASAMAESLKRTIE